jgi:hypothetical protein
MSHLLWSAIILSGRILTIECCDLFERRAAHGDGARLAKHLVAKAIPRSAFQGDVFAPLSRMISCHEKTTAGRISNRIPLLIVCIPSRAMTRKSSQDRVSEEMTSYDTAN